MRAILLAIGLLAPPLTAAAQPANLTITEHSFSDHRVALTAAVLDWLAALPQR